jgi:hypothetical protein
MLGAIPPHLDERRDKFTFSILLFVAVSLLEEVTEHLFFFFSL